MSQATIADDGYELLTQLCNNCIEDRSLACSDCKEIHLKIDKLEEELRPYYFYQEPSFRFERTKEFVKRWEQKQNRCQNRCQGWCSHLTDL